MAEIRLNAIAAVAPSAHVDWRGGAALPAQAQSTQRDSAAPPWFDAKQQLPGIKHRYLSDGTRYSLAAALAAMRDEPGDTPAEDERRGVVFGSSVADYAVRSEFDRIVIEGGADALNTVSAPNISANIAAAHVATACRGRAFSTTLTSPLLAGFEALFLAVQSLRRGRCDEVLSFVAEESLPAGDPTPLMPGAVALRLRAGANAPRHPGRSIAGQAWGYRHAGQIAAPNDVRRFVDAAAALSAPGRAAPHLVVLRDASATAATTAELWRRWLAPAHVAPNDGADILFRSPGSVEPMLHAAHWLTAEHAVVLTAIHHRRYLAFLING